MFDNVAVVIPVLERNRYYSEGDLVKFGDTTLLEWKISQVLEVANKENIYISTPSKKIIELARNYGVNFVNREQETVTYRVEVRIDGVRNNQAGPLELGHDGKWEEIVSFTPHRAGDSQKVEFLLYKNGESEPYLKLHLWINVKE